MSDIRSRIQISTIITTWAFTEKQAMNSQVGAKFTNLQRMRMQQEPELHMLQLALKTTTDKASEETKHF